MEAEIADARFLQGVFPHSAFHPAYQVSASVLEYKLVMLADPGLDDLAGLHLSQQLVSLRLSESPMGVKCFHGR